MAAVHTARGVHRVKLNTEATAAQAVEAAVPSATLAFKFQLRCSDVHTESQVAAARPLQVPSDCTWDRHGLNYTV